MEATKLWEKGIVTDDKIARFTVGRDPEFDRYIAPYDIKASAAHAQMLASVGLLSMEECSALQQGLEELSDHVKNGTFTIEEGVEDVHSQIELFLTRRCGEAGKKIHTARSRNDQVLTAIKLYLKDELLSVREKTEQLIAVFRQLSKRFSGIVLPGYTHFQIAMPSSFDMWLNAYAESLEDDLAFVSAALTICDKNPLGSAAGFGTSFPIDRALTTRLLQFGACNESPVYAQMTRGKSEKAVAIALGAIAQTLSKFAYDVCLYLCQNFGFISFPESLTTGSSIMPHKKNPDVFELLRARCNVLQGLPNQFTLLINNLPSGYHRDMQLTKELIFPAIEDMKRCTDVLLHVLPEMTVNTTIIDDPMYRYLYSVDEVNKLVMNGISFREAYRIIAQRIASQESPFN